MRAIRNMQYVLWGCSGLVFVLPWLIFIPWLMRWSIASIGYVIGALIWAVALFIYAKSRPDQLDSAWTQLRKQFRTLFIAHLALIPIFWIGQGFYLYSQLDQRIAEWRQHAEQQISELVANESIADELLANDPSENEVELIKEQIRPLLMLRAAIADSQMNDFRWIIQEKLGSNLGALHDQISAEIEKIKEQKNIKEDIERRIEENIRKKIESRNDLK